MCVSHTHCLSNCKCHETRQLIVLCVINMIDGHQTNQMRECDQESNATMAAHGHLVVFFLFPSDPYPSQTSELLNSTRTAQPQSD